MLFKLASRLIHTIVFVIFMYFFTAVVGDAIAGPIVFINEIHYDNTGVDKNEFIELAGTTGVNLAGWSLTFYNGGNGKYYKTYTFNDWVLKNSSNGFDFAAVNISGIQNGGSDGIVLADPMQNIIQFISYEGSFTAINGIAKGLTSKDILVNEPSNTPKGYSIQLAGDGLVENFIWQEAANNTFGKINSGQSFVTKGKIIPVNESTSIYLLVISLLLLFLMKVNQSKQFINRNY